MYHSIVRLTIRGAIRHMAGRTIRMESGSSDVGTCGSRGL